MNRYISSKSFTQSKASQGIALLSIVIVFALFCLGLIYLIQTNDLVKQSYQIRGQKENLKKLQTENQELSLQIALWQSPVNLENQVKNLGLVEIKELTYLEKKAVAAK